jgi:hypothetical protein
MGRWIGCALLLLAGCSSPGGFELASRSGSEGTFRAGAASAEFTPDKGFPLAGYGGGERRASFPLWWGLGWPGRLALAWDRSAHETGAPSCLLAPSAGAHDALRARALVLLPGSGPPFALVRIDAIESSARIHARVCELTKDLGFRRETVVLSATHTHSGVGGFLDLPLAELVAMDVYRPDIEERIAKAAADAIRSAHALARPATIAFKTLRDEDAKGKPLIAKNRRARRVQGDEDDLDRDVEVVSVRGLDGAMVATLVNYAVHPTILGTQNHYYSSDLVGPAEAAIARAAGGGEALFFNAAEGDVGPRAGSGGLRECRAEGEAFAAVCSGALGAIPGAERIRIDGALGSRDFGDPFIDFTPGDREAFYRGDEGAGKWLTAPLTLPVNLLVWILGFTNVRAAVTWNLSIGAVVDLSSYGESSRFQGGGIRLRAGGEDVFLFAVPGEATHTVGLELKKRARARGATRVLILGLSDDALGYVATEKEYFEGGYEATMTLFGPDTESKLYDLESGILDAVYGSR